MTSRSFIKDPLTKSTPSSPEESDDWADDSESHTFISSVSDKQSYSSSRLLRGFISMKTMICTAQRQVCMNNRTARKFGGMLKSAFSFVAQIATIIPADMVIHIFTAILVTCGTLTLFFSPSFRSKLSEMRERPDSLQNGVVDSMAWSSDKYDVVVASTTVPTCTERYFRCEYYWASDTDDASNTQNTAYCSAYVCKGMSVTVTVLPQSCSKSNRVGIGAILNELYAKPVYSCGNSGCGECSTLRYHSLEDGIVSFLQGCDGDDSCYGQVAVAITKELAPAVAMPSKVWGHATWGGFRGGQLRQGVSTVNSLPGGPTLMSDMLGGSFRSSPAISSARVAYVGSDDKNLYAVTSKQDSTAVWKFSTGGKVRSSPVLSPDEKTVYVGSDDFHFYALDAVNGELRWKYLTGGMIESSAALTKDASVAYTADKLTAPGILYVGCNDGFLYAISTSGSLKWKFYTAIAGDVAVGSPIRSSPCLSPDDSTVYFGSDNSVMYAVSQTGVLKWYFKAKGAITSSPAISSDGLTLYFGSHDMHIYALSSSGVLKWRYYADSPVHSSCSLFDGIIYFGTTSRGPEIVVPPPPVKAKKTPKHVSVPAVIKPGKGRELRGHEVESAEEVERELAASVGSPVPLPLVPAPPPYVPAALYDGGGLFALTTRGEMLWRFPIPEGTLSSPLFAADGSIYIGAEDSYLYRVSSDGTLVWKYKATGPISASPVLDMHGSIYIGAAGKGEDDGQFSLIVADVDKKAPETPIQTPPLELGSWTCSPESLDTSKSNGQTLDRICEAGKHANNPRISCLPGMANYIGKGVDITLQRDDPKFITRRVLDFSSMKRVQSLHGVEHLAPPDTELSVAAMDEVDVSNPIYSGAFTTVREYTQKQAASFGVSAHYISSRIPLVTVESTLANSTGTWTSSSRPSVARIVSDNAVKGRGTLLNIATYSHTKYDLLPQPAVGQTCSPSFVDDTMDLDDEFEEESYLSYVKRFGTHVIVGVTLGGTIVAESAYDPCSSFRDSRPSTPPETFENFKKDLGDFTVYGRQSDITFLGQVIHRKGMVVCGGDESEFKGPSDTPFNSWSKSTLDHKFRPCAVTMQLIPLYSLISPEDPRRHYIEAAVVNYMNKAKNFASLNTTQITSCQKSAPKIGLK